MAFISFCQVALVGGGWLAAGLGGGTAAYYACVTACTSGTAASGIMATIMTLGVAWPAAAGGTIYGVAACTAACSSLAAGAAFFTGPACFADGVMTTAVHNGALASMPVQHLVEGMLVETFDKDSEMLKVTEVLSMILMAQTYVLAEPQSVTAVKKHTGQKEYIQIYITGKSGRLCRRS